MRFDRACGLRGVIHLGKVALCLAAVGWTAHSAWGQAITFDFDTAAPALQPQQSRPPFDQTIGGLTAHFSTPPGYGAYSIQNQATTGYILSQFAGNYLYPGGLGPNVVDIQFSQELASIAVTFATADFNQAETATSVLLTAYKGAVSPVAAVGSVSVKGLYPGETSHPGDTMPQGTLNLSFTNKTFNLVRISIPYQTTGSTAFLLDNVRVVPVPKLTILQTKTNAAVISWPTNASGYVLTENHALDATNWATCASAVNVIGDQNQVVVSSSSNCFYRLSRP